MNELKLLIGYFIVVNLIGAIANIVDKIKANLDRFRIPEKVLWCIGIVGGATGSYITMQIIRHKTRKKPFAMIFPLLSVIQIILFIYLFLQYYTY